jgi:8-oxo-dGTP pyrophosphatase MutT (NUDIX family)
VSHALQHLLKRCRFYISWPGLVVYFALRPRARVIISDTSGRVLLVQGMWKRWYDDDAWSLPGGGIDHGESPAQAAARELGEELGLAVAAADLQPIARKWLGAYGIGGTVHVFGLTVQNGVAITPQVGEIVAARWYTAAELQSLPLRSDARYALQLLAAAR